jgi:hypothetical protein
MIMSKEKWKLNKYLMRKLILSLVSCVLLLTLCVYEGCTSPVGPGGSFSLSVADVTCTEAWLNLHVNSTPANITIKKNGEAALNFILNTRDTTIYDSTLSPNRPYTYQAVNGSIKTPAITAKTMDTTSHNFTWQLYSLGDALAGNSSMLYDVAIVDENNIWAVGEIYLKDSEQMYNAAHWDGSKWNLYSIYYTDNTGKYISGIRSVFAFSGNDVWFGIGVVFHWNGNEFQSMSNALALPSTINKFWGTSSNDLYVVGNNGNIARYNGSSWSSISSGTTMNLDDIYSADGKNIYIGGGNYLDYSGILLKGNSNGFEMLKEGKDVSNDEIFNPYFVGVAASVWVSKTQAVYFGAHFLYRYIQGQLNFVKTLPGNYPGGNGYAQNWGLINKLRGNGNNDIIMAGERNTLRHFNGVTWQQLGMPYDSNSNYDWFSIDVKNNIAVAVGFVDRNAEVMILKRQ